VCVNWGASSRTGGLSRYFGCGLGSGVQTPLVRGDAFAGEGAAVVPMYRGVLMIGLLPPGGWGAAGMARLKASGGSGGERVSGSLGCAALRSG
jgi:hypothetical protein